MATSYTSLLGLALPVTGELAGTWGDTVNNAITSLLDSAVAGTTTLSNDADVTLTTTTGATNQSRQAILLCNGARTALRTITAPAQSKLYVVINSTTGGFGVKIVGVGPTTGVTVAAGKTAVVVWNGSDFVEVAPATATTATNLAGGVAGSLPYQSAASTTTFLGIGAANYVLTSTGTAPTWTLNTGTGSVVRATSPTITTPTITTSATVPLVIGGTGTTSTLTLRSTSGAGTTGADIIFQTGNNGATEAMRIANSGDISIGTATPASIGGAYRTVTLNASGGSGFIMQAGGITQGLVFADSTLGLVLSGTSGGTTPITFRTSNNERMRIGSDGRVGINTTSPQALLHVSVDGNGALFSRDGAAAVVARSGFDITSDGAFFIGQRARTSIAAPSIVSSGDRTIEVWGRGYDGAAYQSAGRITIDVDGTPAAGSMPGRIVFYTTADGASTTTERMRITSAGNVGIGTASPVAKLDIQGTGAVAAVLNQRTDVTSLSAALMFKTSGFNYWAMRQSSGALTWYQDTAVGGTTTEYMRIDSAGNVGIGTNAPGAKLDVNGSLKTGYIGATSAIATQLSASGAGYLSYTSGATYLSSFADNVGNAAVLAFNTGNSERMRIDTNGNVGIGNAAPGSVVPAALVIDQANSRTGIAIRCTATTGTDNSTEVRMFGYDGAATTIIGQLTAADSAHATLANSVILRASRATGYLRFDTNGANERMRITSAGDMGVGTSSPGSYGKLAVVGTIASLTADTANIGSLATSAGVTSLSSYNATGAALTFSTATTGGVVTERMRITSAGNVGIGTASPGSPLTVYAGNNQATIKVTNGPSANNVGITLESLGGNVVLNNGNGPFELSTGGSIRAVVTTAGNVGIGLTAPAVKLETLGAGTSIGQGYFGTTGFGAAASSIGASIGSTTLLGGADVPAVFLQRWRGSGTNYVTTYVGHASADPYNFVIRHGAVTTFQGVAPERLRIDGSGLVGIGTASPSQLLHIASGDATALIENTAATSNATLQLKYPSRTWALANRGADLSGAFAIRDTTAGADRLIITSAGLVGIGISSDSILTVASTTPIVKIRDLATAAINVGGTFYFQGYTNGVTGLNNFAIITGAKENATAADGSGYFSVQTSNSVGSSAERMRITSGGNVGIGTTTPSGGLVVARANNNGTPIFGVTDTGGANNSYFNLYSRADALLFATSKNGTGTIRPIRFAINDFGDATTGVSLALETNGNVGIGTTTPVNKLDINGSLGRNAPVTKTASFTLAATENWLICNGTATITVTFPAASSWTGREVMIKNIAAFTVVSASSNVVPLVGGAAGTAILAATAGKWVTLVSDGTNWITMAGA